MKFQLTETNRYRRLNRALFGDETGKIKTFAIISPENPLGWKNSTDEEFIKKYTAWTKDKNLANKLAKNLFKASIEDSRSLIKHKADNIEKNGEKALHIGSFNYVPILGNYVNQEKSFVIFNISLDDAKILAREFGQESFFYGHCYHEKGHTSDIAYYKTTDGCKTYKLKEISNTITFEDEADDFFSKFGFKYRINMNEFGDDVIPVDNDGTFDEDMNSTFMSRAIKRRENFSK